MSDDTKRPTDSTVPRSLEPYMGQSELPKGVVRDSSEVRAAFADVDALIESLKQEELDRGVGNAAQYVSPVKVPLAKSPSANACNDAKVALQITDIPRALPPGIPTNPTEEVRNRKPATALRDSITVREARGPLAQLETPGAPEPPSAHVLTTKVDLGDETIPGASSDKWWSKWLGVVLGSVALTVGVIVFAFTATNGSPPRPTSIAPPTSAPIPIDTGASVPTGRPDTSAPEGAPLAAEPMGTRASTEKCAIDTPKSTLPKTTVKHVDRPPRRPVEAPAVPPQVVEAAPISPQVSQTVPSSVPPARTGLTDIF